MARCRCDELGGESCCELARRNRLVRSLSSSPSLSIVSTSTHRSSRCFLSDSSEYANSHVTHIITHEPLSASKNNAFLKKIKGWKPQVVDPQWVYECVAKGRKVDVLKFLILNPCVSILYSFSTLAFPLVLRLRRRVEVGLES